MRIRILYAPLVVAAAASAQTDPSIVGQWSPVVDWGMTATHAHLLPQGQVMWWPEFTHGDNPTLWDPATGKNVPLAFAHHNIFCSGHAFTPDGKLFVAGGHIVDDTGLSTASIFDPATQSWFALPDMNAGRWYPTVTTLPSGDMFVIAGTISPTVGENLVPQVWEQSTGRWRDLSSISLSLPTYPWSFVTPAGGIFIAGVTQTSRFISTSGTGSWVNGPLNHYPQNRTYGSAVMYEPGKVMIAGGGPLADVPTSTMEVIDLSAAAPAWRNVGPLQFARRQLNTTLLPDGTVLITGGHGGVGRDNPNSALLQTELWDPATEQTTLLATSGAYRGYHSTAVLLPDGRVLSAGGTGVTTAQVFSPPYLFRGTPPDLSFAPAEISYGQAFDVASADAARIAQVTLLRLTSVTHSFNMNQRFNRLAFSASSASAITVSAPDRPEIAPPGHYLLFLLDAAGVPSTGKVVHLGAGAPPPSPAGGIAFRSAATNSYPSASTSSMTAAIPAGTVAGDLLLASVGFGNSGATALPAISTPAGWTLVQRVDHGTVNSLAVYWHVFAAGDAAPVWTMGDTVGGDVSISAYSGVAATPIDASAGSDAGSGASYSTPAVATSSANELLVASFFAHSNGGIPTSWTAQSPLTQRSNFNNGGSRSMTTADAPQPAAGASPALGATASSLQDYGLSSVVALLPSGASGPPPPPSPADFSIAASPTSISSANGSSASSVLTMTPSGAFTGTVSLSVAGNPAGSTGALSPSSVAIGPSSGSSTLTLSPGTAAPGAYVVTVTATSGSLIHSANVNYTIAPPPPPPPPAGGIAFRDLASSSYPSGTTNSMTAAIPAGAVAGDLLLASVGFGNSGATALPAISTPAGWTLVQRVDHGTVNSLAVYWHVFAAGDAAPVWTMGDTVGGDVSISAYSGVSATPIDASAGNDAGTGSSYSTPSVATSSANELLVASFFAHSNGGVPTSWTAQSPLTQRSNFNNGGSRSMTTADAPQSAAGVSPALSATSSTLQDYALSSVVALNPAP